MVPMIPEVHVLNKHIEELAKMAKNIVDAEDYIVPDHAIRML